MEKFYKFLKTLSTIIGGAVLLYTGSVVIVSVVHTAIIMING